MSSPIYATTQESGRFYTHPLTGEKMWSVSTIVKALAKPFLIPWAAKEAALCADREWAKLTPMKPAERIQRIKGASARIGSRSSAKGSQIHGIAEEWILAGCPEGWDIGEASRHADLVKWNKGGELLITKNELIPYFEGFVEWTAKFQPTFLHSETTVWNRDEKFAGTLDLIAEIPQFGTCILDIKSGNNLYPEIGLQLAAYANGQFYLADGVETPLPAVKAAFGLHVTAKGTHMVPVNIGDEVYLAFKYVREAYRFQEVISKTILGPEVEVE